VPEPAGLVCFGHVDLEYGVTGLAPTLPGRVAELLVRENDEVAAGTVLLRLEDRAARLRVAEARAALAAAQAQLTQTRKAPEQQQVRIAQQQAALDAAEHRLQAARQTLTRRRDLHRIDQLNAADVVIAEEQVKELEAMEKAARGVLAEIRLHDPSADVERTVAEVAAVKARLDQAEHALEECSLRAPKAGKVLRILVGPGDFLAGQPGQPAVQFSLLGPRIVRAEVDQEFARRLAIGQTALVEDETAASGVHHGRVTQISDWYTRRRSVLQEPFERNDVRTLECLISLEDGRPPLRIGQRVRVTIRLPNPN
jgi:multidrug resistance efflux pump